MHAADWLKGSELFKGFIGGVIGKPGSDPITFPDYEANRVVGSLVKFNDDSNRGVRMFPAHMLVDKTFGQVLDDPRTGVVFDSPDLSRRAIFASAGTNGKYMFRVYNPFLI